MAKPALGRKRWTPSTVETSPLAGELGAERRRLRRGGEPDLLLEGKPREELVDRAEQRGSCRGR